MKLDSRVARLLPALPALLLAAVAASQLWLAQRAQLTPWCGGGFGMFSTIDGWGARHLHAVLHGPGWRQELEVPARLADLHRRALALPDQARLGDLARSLLEDNPDGERVELLVFARRFDRDTLMPRGVAIASFEARRDER